MIREKELTRLAGWLALGVFVPALPLGIAGVIAFVVVFDEQRQQAGAIIAARQKIVEGAVSMVEMALHQLTEGKIVELDDERRAAMVSNLLVVLCGERGTQPVLNTGTIYQ